MNHIEYSKCSHNEKPRETRKTLHKRRSVSRWPCQSPSRNSPFIVTQLNSTRRRVELSCVAINGPLHLVQRWGAWTGWGTAQSPPRCTECNSTPINGQCTNHYIDGPLVCGFNVAIKGLQNSSLTSMDPAVKVNEAYYHDVLLPK